MKKARNRLPAETVGFIVSSQSSDGEAVGHRIEVSLASDPETGLLREVAFVGRGKIGHGVDLMLHELGIKLSRAIQGRDPDTGESA